MTKFMETHLQPLNSPLTFNGDAHIFQDNEDTTNHSYTSKLSPWHIIQLFNIDNNFNGKSEKVDFTPIQKNGFIDSSYIDDKKTKEC